MSIKDYYRSMVDKHPLAAEILRFVLVGIAATLVDYVVSALVLFLFDPGGYPTFLSFLGVGKNAEPSTAASVVSTGVGFIAGLIVNYILSIVFVYINKGKSKTTIGFVIFAALAAGGLAVNLVGMWLIYNVSGLAGSEHSMIWYWAVKIMLTTIVLMYNYITRKTIIFKSSKNIAAETEGASDEK